jgi:hypothetical protein
MLLFTHSDSLQSRQPRGIQITKSVAACRPGDSSNTVARGRSGHIVCMCDVVTLFVASCDSDSYLQAWRCVVSVYKVSGWGQHPLHPSLAARLVCSVQGQCQVCSR